jgi:hypothetical protein
MANVRNKLPTQTYEFRGYVLGLTASSSGRKKKKYLQDI